MGEINNLEEMIDEINKKKEEEQRALYNEQLRAEIERDPTKAIESGVHGSKVTSEFLARQRMQPKEKYGDIIVPSSNIEQLIDMVRRHYKKLNNEKKGTQEIREI